MSLLSVFGLFAVTAMMVCYAFEARSRWFVLAFAGSCLLGSVYGFLQGAWPFGIVKRCGPAWRYGGGGRQERAERLWRKKNGIGNPMPSCYRT